MVKDRRKFSSSYPSNISHHFFKVYLPAISSQRLNIPTTFIKSFHGVIPQKTILKGPLGGFWQVELEKIKDSFFFHNGWQAFVKDHSLKLGEFLVFRYDGNSVFDVKIFDNSGCEKEEALSSRNNKEVTVFIKEEDQEEESETFSMPVHGFKGSYAEETLNKIDKTSPENIRSKSAEVKVGKQEVFKANDFVEPMHPQFVVFLNPSRPYHLHIPKLLVIENKLKIKPEMILRDPKRRSWPVRVCFMKNGRIVITKGWRDFCKANDLVKRDKCIFRFLQGKGRRGDVINVDIVKTRCRGFNSV